MATYAVLGPNNAVQQVPIQTWGDTFYVLFGKAFRDTVNSVDQAITGVVRPAFDQKKDTALKTDGTIAEALKDRCLMLLPEKEVVLSCFHAISQCINRYDYRWNEWSQLFDLRFLSQVLAYVIHAFASGIWDLVDGTYGKVAHIQRECRDIYCYEHFIDVSRWEDKDGSELGGSVSLLEPVLGSPTGLCIHYKDSEMDLTIEVERCWSHNLKPIFEGEMPQDLAADPSKLDMPSLLVTFDLDNITNPSQNVQSSIAIDLMLRERSSLLVIRTRSEMDFSRFGFEKIEWDQQKHGHEEVDDFKSWRLSDAVQQPVQIVMESESERLARVKIFGEAEQQPAKWSEIVRNDFSDKPYVFDELNPEEPLFPKEFLFAPKPVEANQEV